VNNYISQKDLDWGHAGGDPAVFVETKKIWKENMEKFKNFDVFFWNLNSDIIESHINFHTREISIPGTYNDKWSLESHCKLLKIINDNIYYDFIIYTTLGSFWVIPRLEKKLEELPKERLFCGSGYYHLGPPGGYPAWHAGIISRDLTILFCNCENYNDFTNTIRGHYDDVAFGWFFYKHGINFYPFSQNEWKSLEDGNTNIEDMLKDDDNSGIIHYRVKSINQRHLDIVILNKLYSYYYT
jgi:hypothetical protein